MKRSDGTEMWLCNGCGTIPIFNEGQSLFLCPMCDGPIKDNFKGKTAEELVLTLPVRQSRTTFSKVEIPYSLKLMEQELTRGSYQLRFLTAKDSRGFHEEKEGARAPAPAEANTGTAGAAGATAAVGATGASEPKTARPKKPKAIKMSGPVAAVLKMGGGTDSLATGTAAAAAAAAAAPNALPTVAQEMQDMALLSRMNGVPQGVPQGVPETGANGSGTTVNIMIPGVSAGAQAPPTTIAPVAPVVAPVATAPTAAGGAGEAAAPASSGGLLGGITSAVVNALNAPVSGGVSASTPSAPSAPSAPSVGASGEGGPTLTIREPVAAAAPVSREESDVKIVSIV